MGDSGRRRRWPLAEKRRIVEESFRPGHGAEATARRHGLSRSQMYLWRQRYRAGHLCGEDPGTSIDDINPLGRFAIGVSACIEGVLQHPDHVSIPYGLPFNPDQPDPVRGTGEVNAGGHQAKICLARAAKIAEPGEISLTTSWTRRSGSKPMPRSRSQMKPTGTGTRSSPRRAFASRASCMRRRRMPSSNSLMPPFMPRSRRHSGGWGHRCHPDRSPWPRRGRRVRGHGANPARCGQAGRPPGKRPRRRFRNKVPQPDARSQGGQHGRWPNVPDRHQ